MTDRSPEDTSASPDPRDEDGDLRVSPLDAELEAADGRPRSRLPAALDGPAMRRLWRWTGVVAIIALTAIVIVAVAPHISLPAPRRPPIPYTTLKVSGALEAESELAGCVFGGAWSPDGRQVAAILTPNCSTVGATQTSAPPNLLIFDAATGVQTASYDLTTATRAALVAAGERSDDAAVAAINYYDARWSPDGSQIATWLDAYGVSGGVTGVALALLTGPARGHVRVLLDGFNTGLNYPDSAFAPFPVDRWDLRNNASSTVYLTPALAYRWLPDDTLVADEPLGASGAAPPPSDPAGAAGNPIGGQAFTLWHVGNIAPVMATVCGGSDAGVSDPVPQPYALLSLGAPVWSPDGRYVLYISAQSRLPTDPGRPAPATSGSSPCDYGAPPDQVARAPFHDNGLRSALGLLDRYGKTQLTLAWSPDGRRLAVMPDSFTQDSDSLIIYDTASGRPILGFDPSQFEAQVAQYALVSSAVWSPDSRSLLLTISLPSPRLVILGPAALGR